MKANARLMAPGVRGQLDEFVGQTKQVAMGEQQ
ncbi:hypothetical protein STH12_03093 [Shewanella khirikhana]|uniref:Uncharacterized protein n=1 Tax=Shewanella khirikhana TaxID=1965282 RepID=A0ABM7DR35_9GAMM|nr:hypothetical protein STH12_03093 [Shewanella khirikhana]